jgi:hypothetical protein
MNSDTFDRLVKNTQSKEARDLANWWDMHQEAERLSKALYKTCL